MSTASTNITGRLKIVVLGYLVRGPIGGMAWHHLQYVLGLKRLGHDVLFLEDSDDYPSCYDPTTHQVGTDPRFGVQFVSRVFTRCGISEAWAYYDAPNRRWWGPAADRAVASCKKADIVLNVSGVNPLRDWWIGVPNRVFIDTDPVFTQVKSLTDSEFRQRIDAHTAHVSFGECIETGTTDVPDDGIRWRATRQPVVLEAWPFSLGTGRNYTTVMQWQSYSSVEFGGLRYGTKRESFDMIERLPTQVDLPLEIALGSASAPRERLKQIGWLVRDPIQAAPDPWSYQAYLSNSRGELSVAKHAYVATRSGWFSERSACYLASGRPVVVQDTGFSELLPVGAGLHAFQSMAGAIEALLQIERNYAAECLRAREIAEEYFDSDKVLTRLLESIG